MEIQRPTQEISREFDASIPYTVSRALTGYVDEVLPATDTIIITGDIVMEEMDVRNIANRNRTSQFCSAHVHLMYVYN